MAARFFGHTKLGVNAMKEKKIYGAASVLLAGVLVYVGFLRFGNGKSETVYAHGEYVQALEGTQSPFAAVAQR